MCGAALRRRVGVAAESCWHEAVLRVDFALMNGSIALQQISFVEWSRFMARRVAGGGEGSVKTAEGAAQRSKQSGEPLQVPTASAIRRYEADHLMEEEIRCISIWIRVEASGVVRNNHVAG